MTPYLRLALHVGGDEAPAMAARMSGEAPATHRAPGCTMTVSGGAVRASEDRLIAVGGHPLGLPALDGIADASDFARRLGSCDGAFYGVYWEAASRRLVIVTDCLGLQPLYWQRRPGEVLLASETKAFRGKPDLAAWGSFLSIGHTIGDQTLMHGVRRVPPGAVLTVDVEAGTVDETPHWRWPEPAETTDVAGLVDALRVSVRRHAELAPGGAVLLSGGCDSRLVSCLLLEAGFRPDAVIVSHADELFDADARLAAQVARRLGLPYTVHRPGADFFSSPAYLRYIDASDAGTPSLYLFIAQVMPFCRQPVLWEGAALGVTLGASYATPGGFAADKRAYSLDRGARAWQAAATVFRPEVVDEMYEGHRAAYRREIEKYSDDSWGVTQFLVRNQIRHRTAINPLKAFARHAAVFPPVVSRDFFSLAGQLSYEARRGFRLYRQLFEHLRPDALALPFCTGGGVIPGRPGSWRCAVERVGGAAFRFAKAHPRAAHGLGLSRHLHSFTPSRFAAPQVLAATDPLVREWRAEELCADTAAARDAQRLLFHWRAWHWLHQGELFERLRSYAVEGDPA